MPTAEKVLSSVLKDDYISVVLKTKEGVVPYSLTPSHPTFSKLHKALEKGNVARVPALVTLARAIANKTQGRVTFTKSGVQFRGTDVPEVISRLAALSMKETGDSSAWLRFVENLYKNPEKRSREELVEFLYGHDAGDRILKAVAQTLVLNVRAFDVVGRWGGEEFVVIIRNITEKNLAKLAEKLRVLVGKSFVTLDASQVGVTVSIGATTLTAEDTLESAVGRADTLMYRSKAGGRNRVTLD